MTHLSSKRFRRMAGTALAAVAAMLIASGAAVAKTSLVVYTALEDEQLPVFKKAFEAAVQQKMQEEMMKLQSDMNRQLKQQQSKNTPVQTASVISSHR